MRLPWFHRKLGGRRPPIVLGRQLVWGGDWQPIERRLVVSFGILSLGTGLSLSVLAVYLVRQLHASPPAFGVAMSVAALCGMVSGPLAGWVSDRANARRTYAGLVWTMATATALLALANDWTAFTLLSLLVMCGRGSGAVLGALVGREVPPDRRVRYRAVLKTASNSAMLAGLSFGGIVLSLNSRPLFQVAFVVEAVTLFAAGLLVSTSPSPATVPPGNAAASENTDSPAGAGDGKRVYRDTRFLVLSVINAFVLLYSSVFTVALPLWIAAQASSLLWLVSVASALNLGVVLLIQVPVSKAIRGTRSAVRIGRTGGLLLAAGVLMFAVAGSVHGNGPKAIAIVVLALLVAGGEVLYSVASWELVYALAPAESLGEYQGVYNMGLDVSMLIAPMLFAWLASGKHFGEWAAVSAVFVLCALLLGPVMSRRNSRGAAVPAF